MSHRGDLQGRHAEVLAPALHVPVHLGANAVSAAHRHQAIRQLDLQRELFETACSICGVCDAVKELARANPIKKRQ